MPRAPFAFAALLLSPLLAAEAWSSAARGGDAAPPRTSSMSAEDAAPDARELFLANCALCHGVEGDGEGVTDLDRKARSFKDGGFSYGNTPETVQRTIRTGIPGTPMPAFGEALDDAAVAALADYVIGLGPGLPPEPENSELVVTGRPVFVRGMLPPIAETGRLRTRGLLLGYPDGFTFEYRVDDVRLLGVRLGRFVDRTDWTGRGGTPLKPLGQVVVLCEGGDPGPTFDVETPDGLAPLSGRLSSTALIQAGETREVGHLSYDLVDPEGHVKCHAEESIEPVTLSVGSGYRRIVRVVGGHANETLQPRALKRPGLELLRVTEEGLELYQRALPGGVVELSAWFLFHPAGAAFTPGEGAAGVSAAKRFEVRERELVALDAVVVQLSATLLEELGREAVEAALIQELSR